MSLLIFLACAIILAMNSGWNKGKKDLINYYADHYNWLPKEERAKQKAMAEVVKEEIGRLQQKAGPKGNPINAEGKQWFRYWCSGGNQLDEIPKARSKWIMAHCKAKGIPCTQFIADELSGMNYRRQEAKEAEDIGKYGLDYVKRNYLNYL